MGKKNFNHLSLLQIEYIASQGPIEDTCHDFWRMILEQNAELIVMLTNLIDGETEKCFKYFPDGGKQLAFGDIKVTFQKKNFKA